MDHIGTDIRPPVARIWLANPPLNVIDITMMRELSETLATLEACSDITFVVIKGEGRVFSAGVDVKAHVPEQVREMLTSFHAVIRALVASTKITIATVHGTCLGGGAELASVCDIVYTARDTTWGFPEIKLGCFPPVAAVALPALVGHKQATDLILTGRQISGQEAVTLGLATRAVRMEEMEGVLLEKLAELRQYSAVALTHAKKSLHVWDAIHFDKGLARAEKIYLEELVSTADAREGIMAFLGKRSPEWTGK